MYSPPSKRPGGGRGSLYAPVTETPGPGEAHDRLVSQGTEAHGHGPVPYLTWQKACWLSIQT